MVPGPRIYILRERVVCKVPRPDRDKDEEIREIRVEGEDHQDPPKNPAILKVNRHSREVTLRFYRRAFADVDMLRTFYFDFKRDILACKIRYPEKERFDLPRDVPRYRRLEEELIQIKKRNRQTWFWEIYPTIVSRKLTTFEWRKSILLDAATQETHDRALIQW